MYVATAKAIQTVKQRVWTPLSQQDVLLLKHAILWRVPISTRNFYERSSRSYQGKLVYSSEIPTETVERFHQMVKEDGYGFTAYNDKEFYLVESQKELRMHMDLFTRILLHWNEDFYIDNPINMPLFICLSTSGRKYKAAFVNLDFYGNTP